MSTIRVLVSIVSPTDNRQAAVDAEPSWTLVRLIDELVRERSLSAGARWQFKLPDGESLATVGELFARSGYVEPLHLVLVEQADLGGSAFEFQLPEDVGSISELRIPEPGSDASDTRDALPPKPETAPRPGASFDFINLPDSGSFAGIDSSAPRKPNENAPAVPASEIVPGASGSSTPPAPPALADEDADLAAESEQAAPPPPAARSAGAPRRRDEVAETAPRTWSAPAPTGRARSAPDARMSSGTVARHTARRATVRYYSRMNPDRMFPLLVVLSKEEVAEIVKAKVKQAQSEAFQVEEGSVVEVEPVLPGCDCYPPRHALTVDADGTTSATIWVVPKVLGRIQGARVLIRQGTKILAEVPLDVKVAKQTLAVACGLLSLAAPYLTMGLKSLKFDYESQKAEGFPLYQRAGGWVADNLRPEWLGLGFLGLALLLYLWMRPRRRDVFWDVNPK